MARIFADEARAKSFAEDAGLSLALAVAVDRLLAAELARKLTAAIYYDADRAIILLKRSTGEPAEAGARAVLVRSLSELRDGADFLYRLVTSGGVRVRDLLTIVARLHQTAEVARRADSKFAESRTDRPTLNEVAGLVADAAERAFYLMGGLRQDLRDADLRGARLSLAELAGSDLSGADLMGADLAHADLEGALWSVATSWPTGMLPTVEANSTEIRPGVYRVNTPRDRDWTNSPVGVR
jgi:hypothetical protein